MASPLGVLPRWSECSREPWNRPGMFAENKVKPEQSFAPPWRIFVSKCFLLLPGSASFLIACSVLIVPASLWTHAAEAPASAMPYNPLLVESTLPYHFPRFDLIKDESYASAFELGMVENLKEVEAIATNAVPATFENTIVALERCGELLGRVNRIFSNLIGTVSNPGMQALEKELSPKLAAHGDAIRLNNPLFARVQDLHNRRESLGLDAESKWLLERYHKDFVRAGAKLSEKDKTQLKALNAELATLQTAFAQNVLKESNAQAILVETREALSGLSENAIAAAGAAAKADGKGGFLLRLMNTSGQPALSSLKNRALRERLLHASLSRCSHGGEFDNRASVARIAKLRAQRAALLGFPSHAAYVLEDQTAGSIDAVNGLLSRLVAPAIANAKREAADIQALIDQESGGFKLAAWDWAIYSEKVRAARYAYDESQLRPYFEMNRVLVDGVFFAATKLYGITFKERTDLPRYHPDTRIFEVFNQDGSRLACFIVDWYARPSKRGGAWANAYVPQSRLLGRKPVIANHLNIPKPPEGQPTLLTYDEVNTAFHEFGHALHGMFSSVLYPRFAGTSVPRDFVEYPSQVNEMWTTWPEILKHYARHYQTDEPIPQELLDKVLAASKFDQGFKTTEYLAAALLDQAWHQLNPEQIPEDVPGFEKATMAKVGLDFSPVPPRYRSAYFSHTFSGGYSAGYYSYIWSEVLDADSVEWFKKNGGLKRENGDRFRKLLLSRGGSVDSMQLYRDFTGGDPDIKALLKRRGLDSERP